MRVIVDGIVYGRQTHGGINTYFNQVLPRIASRPETIVEVLLPAVCKGGAPGEPVRRLARDLLPTRTGLSWRLDERLQPAVERFNMALTAVRAMSKRGVVFQSTYFTSLPCPVRHVAIALDLNHEVFPHLYADDFGRWLRHRYPRYLRDARRIIAISQTTKRHLTEFYGTDPDLVDVVHLATDPSIFYEDRSESALRHLSDQLDIRLPYLLYVGVHSSAFKNFTTLLEAVVRWTARAPLTLVVAGPPWNHQERELIRALPRDVAVRLVPEPADALLRMLYSFAAAFVYPSMAEGFGIPLLEAMACGTTILASDITVFHEVAGDAAIYFDPRDSGDLVKAIERALDPIVRAEYRARGLRQLGRYSWDRAAAETYRVYEKALA